MEGLKNNPIVKAIGTQRLVALIALIVIYISFGLLNNKFFSYATMVNIFDASYYIGFMAIGITFVIATGGIDLSIGTVLSCSALMAGYLNVSKGLPIVPTMILCIIIGALFGLMNGLMVSKMKLPPFIATLGSMMLSKGLGAIVTMSQSVTWKSSTSDEGWYRNIFRINSQEGAIVPTGFLLLIVSAIIMAIVLNKTRPGRYILALGSNLEATRLSGVDVDKWQTLAYIFSGLFAGIAGVSYASIYQVTLPGAGSGFEMDAIAGVVIGGTSMSGGNGTIAGTMIGVFIISVLKTGLPFIGLNTAWQQVATGLVLIIAVFIDVCNRRRKG